MSDWRLHSQRSTNHRMPFSLNDQESLLSQFKDILLENKSLYARDDVRVKIAGLLSAMKQYFVNIQLYASIMAPKLYLEILNKEKVQSSPLAPCRAVGWKSWRI